MPWVVWSAQRVGRAAGRKKVGCLLVIYRRLCRLSEWHYLCPRCFSKVVQTRKASRLSCRACRILISTGPSVVINMHREFPFFSRQPAVRDASLLLLQHITSTYTTAGHFAKDFQSKDLLRKGREKDEAQEESERGEWARLGGPTLGAGAEGGRPRTDREREQLSIEPSREGASSWDSTPRLFRGRSPQIGEGEWTRHAEGRFLRRRRAVVRPG